MRIYPVLLPHWVLRSQRETRKELAATRQGCGGVPFHHGYSATDLKHPKNSLIHISEPTDSLTEHTLIYLRRVYLRGTCIKFSDMNVLEL